MNKVDKWLKAWGRWSQVNECRGYPKKSTGICGADVKLETLKQFSLSEDMAVEIDNAIKKLSLHDEKLLTLIKLMYIHNLTKKHIVKAKLDVESYKDILDNNSEAVSVVDLIAELGYINEPTFYRMLEKIKGYILGSIEAKDTSILFE